MPSIYRSNDFVIRIYPRDHVPPHFHVLTVDGAVSVEIETLEVMRGSIRKKALKAALEWASDNQDLLRAKWIEINGG